MFLGTSRYLDCAKEKALFSTWLSYAAKKRPRPFSVTSRIAVWKMLVGLALGRDGQHAMAESH